MKALHLSKSSIHLIKMKHLTWPQMTIMVLSAFVIFSITVYGFYRASYIQGDAETESWCPLPDIKGIPDHGRDLRPSIDLADNSSMQMQVERLSAAVHVPTESWDDNEDVNSDPRWKFFDDFHRVLEKLFPLVYA